MQTLSDLQVLSDVKALVSKGAISWTRHAEERMALRGIDKDMIKECLLKGSFEEPPYISNKSKSINYEFKLIAAVDGIQLSVAAALYPGCKVSVITCFA